MCLYCLTQKRAIVALLEDCRRGRETALSFVSASARTIAGMVPASIVTSAAIAVAEKTEGHADRGRAVACGGRNERVHRCSAGGSGAAYQRMIISAEVVARQEAIEERLLTDAVANVMLNVEHVRAMVSLCGWKRATEPGTGESGNIMSSNVYLNNDPAAATAKAAADAASGAAAARNYVSALAVAHICGNL